MNYLIYINKLSEPVLAEVPEKPICNCDEIDGAGDFEEKHERCDSRLKEYEQALAVAIADESKHIRFRDDQPIVQLLWSVNDDGYPHLGRWLNKRKGQTFPLPKGVSVSFEEEIDEYVYPYGSWMKKFALLVQEPKVEDNWQHDIKAVGAQEQLKEKQEYILCAANYYNDGKEHPHNPKNISIGFVTAGRRHCNCIHTFAQIVGFPYSEAALEIMRTEIQGFLTNTNRFVGRKEAYDIAFKADQIKGPNRGYSKNTIGLTSEDLY